MLPVTGTGALVLTFVAVPFEHAHLFVMGRAGIFGWLDAHYLPRVAYLAIMPGIVGELPRSALLLSTGACTAQGLHQAHTLCSSVCDQLSQGAFLVAAGHTGFNYLVKYVHPLIISLVLTLEPLVGSMLGWARGVAPLPGHADTAPLCHKTFLHVQGMTSADENCVR